MSGDTIICRSARLVPVQQKNKLGFVTAYAYEPATSEAEKGFLYFVIEVMTAAEVGREIAQLIVETVKAEFYRDREKSVGRSFEDSLVAINDALGTLTERGRIEWLGRVSATIAAVKDNELYLTKCGSAETYLFRRTLVRQVSEGTTYPDRLHPFRTFSSVTSGTLVAGDRLIFSTPGLFYFLSLEEMQQILNETTASGAIQTFAKMAESKNQYRAAVIVLELATLESLAHEPILSGPSEVFTGPQRGFAPAAAVAAPLVNTLSEAFPDDLRARFIRFTAPLRNILRKMTFIRRSNKLKIVGAAALGLLLIGGFGLNRAAHRNRLAQEQTAILAEAAKSIEAAEAAGPSDRAANKALLAKAASLLDGVSLAALRDDAEALRAKITKLLDAADRVVRLAPEQLADVSALSGDLAALSAADADTLFIVTKDGRVYRFSRSKKELIQTDSLREAVTASDLLEAGPTLLLLTDKGSLFSVDPKSGKAAKKEVPGGFMNGNDLAHYTASASSTLVYILDAAGGKLARFTQSGGTFTAKEPYPVSGVDLKAAVGLAIDDMVYLLTPSGVQKLSRGKPVAFSLDLPSPLNNPTQIMTAAGFENIYINDRGGKRVLAFTKTGALAAQYPLPESPELIFPDEKAQRVYYTSGKKIFALNLNP